MGQIYQPSVQLTGQYPVASIVLSPSQTLAAGVNTFLFQTGHSQVTLDSYGYWVTGTAVYVPQVAGVYEVTCVGIFASSGVTVTANILATLNLIKNGAATALVTEELMAITGQPASITLVTQALFSMNGSTDQIQAQGAFTGTGTLTAAAGSSLLIKYLHA